MECTLWRDMASDYLEGTLSPAMMEAMRSHLAVCPSCRQDAEALRGLSHELNLLPSVDPPLFFRENVIAAIERQQAGRPIGPWWRTLVPQLGRVALGTALTGGMVAAVAWTLLMPSGKTVGKDTNTAALSAAPLANLLPGVSASDEQASALANPPYLRIARVASMVPGSNGPAYDFSFWLENAQKGTARWHFVGEKTPYRFNLSSTAQTVRVPYSAAQGRDSLALVVYWTADAQSHSRYLLLPVPRDTDRNAPEEKQSFGLAEESVVDAAREVAARYGTPVTLDDVSTGLRVRVTARDETAPDTLRRNLSDLGLKVTASRSGILIRPDDKTTASPEAAAADPTAGGSGSDAPASER